MEHNDSYTHLVHALRYMIKNLKIYTALALWERDI